MISQGHALARDELIRTLTAYQGITTSDGAGDGTTLFDINLKDNPSISANAIPEKTILIISGDAAQEDKGATSFDNATGKITLQGTGFSTQIKKGTIYRILNISSVETIVVYILTLLGLTTFTQKTAPATDVNGTTWKDLLDMSVLAKQEEIWQITLTVAGGWAGNCQIRFVDGSGNKIFPFGAQAVQGTDFFSGVPWLFPAPIVVPIASGYKLQFRSSNAGDGAGKTCQLNELAVIQRG